MMQVVSVILYLLLAPLAGALLDGVDRKISARMQGRQGPPLLQPFYDLGKLFTKQMLAVNSVQIFLLLSYLIFLAVSGSLLFAGGGYPHVPVHPVHGGYVPGHGGIQRLLPLLDAGGRP